MMKNREAMKQMSLFKYVLRDGFRLVIRHLGMSFLTIFTAMAVFFVVGISTLFVLNVKNIVVMMENQLTITAYVVPKADIEEIAKLIKKMPEVKEVKIITKEMALEKLRARVGDQAKAVSLLGENPLPASIEIKVGKAAQVSDTAKMLVAISEIEDVVFAGRVAEKLTRVSNFVERFSWILLFMAIAASGVVLFNTIRISVYSRENEISVMLRVGATPTYVMMPFIIQAVVLGFTGAAISTLLIGATYYSAISGLKDMMPFLPFIESKTLIFKLAFMLITCGSLISFLSGMFAAQSFVSRASKPL